MHLLLTHNEPEPQSDASLHSTQVSGAPFLTIIFKGHAQAFVFGSKTLLPEHFATQRLPNQLGVSGLHWQPGTFVLSPEALRELPAGQSVARQELPFQTSPARLQRQPVVAVPPAPFEDVPDGQEDDFVFDEVVVRDVSLGMDGEE